ncbi:hypothetical protein KEH51_29470 [[Brevibacterium] frigoritolerans]|uniref:Uncharacterized protein n=1 Tax=Peribacillus frigoritolerans TaxID=450367 RepID=A0A941FLM7_9BACI|nr:hypothetical protein [Peribacillus frigoritolerans]
MIGAEVRDSCGSSGTGGDPTGVYAGGSPPAPRKASIWRKSTTTHYLVNSNKVWENSQK